MSPPEGDGGCQIGELFELLGRPHVLDILDIITWSPEPVRFADLQRKLSISPNTLSNRLKALQEAGLLTRTAYNEIPPRVDYAPTPKASDLCHVFGAMREWTQKHDLRPVPEGAEAEPAPTPA